MGTQGSHNACEVETNEVIFLQAENTFVSICYTWIYIERGKKVAHDCLGPNEHDLFVSILLFFLNMTNLMTRGGLFYFQEEYVCDFPNDTF